MKRKRRKVTTEERGINIKRNKKKKRDDKITWRETNAAGR